MGENKNQSALYLAIDQGGHASRALVFDELGQQRLAAFREIATRSEGERVEHDAEALLQSVRDAIDEVVTGLGADAARLRSAGLATQRSSMVCWDAETGAALSPVLSWQDRRAAELLQGWQTDFSRMQAISGLFPNAHYAASKMQWCLRHLSAVQQALAEGHLCMGPLASFLLFRLLVERPFVCDPSNAQRSLLMEVQTCQWSQALLQRFEIPAAVLPQIQASDARWGHLPLGERELPLRICTGDQAAALFAEGWPPAGEARVNLGTGGFVQLPVQGDVAAGRLLRSASFVGAERRLDVLEGTINGAGRALQWFAQRYAVEDLEMRLPGWLAGEVQPDIFLNAVSGLGSPFWQAAESRFLLEREVPAKAVAVVESILFLLQENLRRMPACGSLLLSGGLSAMDGLCQRLANLSGLPVKRLQNPEATARGLAFLLAGQPQRWQPTAHCLFRPQSDPELAARYQAWRDAMPACG